MFTYKDYLKILERNERSRLLGGAFVPEPDEIAVAQKLIQHIEAGLPKPDKRILGSWWDTEVEIIELSH